MPKKLRFIFFLELNNPIPMKYSLITKEAILFMVCFGLSFIYGRASANTKTFVHDIPSGIDNHFTKIQGGSDTFFFDGKDFHDYDLGLTLKLKNIPLPKSLDMIVANGGSSYVPSDRSALLIKRLEAMNKPEIISMDQTLIEVSGTITEADSGMPISGANIVEKGTTNGVMTDFDGNYSLEVPEDATLEEYWAREYEPEWEPKV